MAIVSRLRGLHRKEHFWIVVLTLLVLAMHFSVIITPAEIVLDEVYYVNDAREIIAGEAQLRGEHTPLGTLFITAGIMLFGDNAFGWRIFPVLMGSANILLVYLVCRQLKMARWAANIAGFLVALENLTFVQSSVAMLDVFSLFFMLLSFWMYLRRDYPASALLGCLGVLCKLTGALGFIVIILHWLLTRRDRRPVFLLSMALAPVFFVILLPVADIAAAGYMTDPLQRIINMFSLGGQVTFSGNEHPFFSHPWEWVLFPRVMPYYYEPDYLAMISPPVWALIIPAVVYLAVRIRHSPAALFGLLWFAVTYLVWIPANLLTDRMTFVFYFYPVIGAVCVGLALGLEQLRDYARSQIGKKRWLVAAVYGYLALHAAAFVMLSPVFSRWLPSLKDILL